MFTTNYKLILYKLSNYNLIFYKLSNYKLILYKLSTLDSMFNVIRAYLIRLDQINFMLVYVINNICLSKQGRFCEIFFLCVYIVENLTLALIVLNINLNKYTLRFEVDFLCLFGEKKTKT